MSSVQCQVLTVLNIERLIPELRCAFIRVISTLIERKFCFRSDLPEGYAKILLLCIGVFFVLFAGILLGLTSGVLTVFILREAKFSSVLPGLEIYPAISSLAGFIISVWIVFYLICLTSSICHFFNKNK